MIVNQRNRTKHQKVLVLGLVIFFAIGFGLGNSNFWIFPDVVEKGWYTLFDTEVGDQLMNEPVPDYEVYEGSFQTAAQGSHYVDAKYSTTYGTTTNDPSAGMGDSNAATYTTLTEGSYTSGSTTTLLEQTLFTALPSGWVSSSVGFNIDSVGGLNDNFGNLDGFPDNGIIYCSTVDTTGYSQVTFQVRLYGDWDTNDIDIHFYDSADTWNLITNPSSSLSWVYSSPTSTDSQYQINDFSVRISHSDIYSDMSEFYRGREWKISGYVSYTYYRFMACFSFSGVDYGYASFFLYVDFYSSYTEGYSFDIEAGDGTPDNTVATGQTNDFNVDVSSYIIGSTVYLEIYDMTGSDADQDAGQIARCYLFATNTAPSNDATPTCSNLDDTDNLYAMNKDYQITTYHSDIDGRGNIDYVYLECYSNNRATMYWRLGYDGATFSELSDPNDYIFLSSGSTSGSGNDLDLTFNVRINWNHPDISDIDLRCIVYDNDGTSDDDFYEVNWDMETRLDLSALGLSDSSGTIDRGNVNGFVLASGTVVYYGSSIHPSESLIDVYLTCAAVSTSPWEATNYAASTGDFSITVTADDEVGIDTYNYRVVGEGDSATGTDLLQSPQSLTYISDKIVCTSLSSPSMIIDSSATGYMYVDLEYASDNSAVVDGTYQLGNRWIAHISGGSWQASYSPLILTSVTYDTISPAMINAHGITEIDMDGNILNMYWEQLSCFIDGPTPDIIDINNNATGIYVRAEYQYWASHGHQFYDGTLNLNNTIFNYTTVGTRGYIVSSAVGNDTWGITTILSSESTSCTWIYPDPPPSWNVIPADQIVEYGFVFSYPLDADVQYGVPMWWLNDTTHFSISVSGVVTNATFLSPDAYPLQVWVNDTYGREITAIFTVTVEDNTSPVWGSPLENQYHELLEPYRQVLDVIAEKGVDQWWLNGTPWFAIDEFGAIINATFLPVGVYGIEVSVNDTWGRTLTGSFSVTIQDTTGPEFGSNPTSIVIEFGANLNEQLFASDFSGISHWDVNDTVHFAITGTGLLFNLTLPGDGSYGLEITVYDVYDNPRTTSLTIIVNLGAAPTWVETPVDQLVEFGDAFEYDLDALDDSGIESWSIDDTTNFAIDTNGTITSLDTLAVGEYDLEISVSDTLGYVQSTTVTVTVEDTSAPVWTVILSDMQINYGAAVGFQLGASDLSGISSWIVNASVTLAINETGYLSSVGIIPVGQYVVLITASDPYGNSVSGSFLLTVEGSDSFLGMSPIVLLIIGIGSVGIVIILFLGRNVIIGRIRGSPTAMLAIRKLSRMEGKFYV